MHADDLERRARERLDPDVYDYVAGGSGDEETLTANVRAWGELALRPRILRSVEPADTSTSLLGTPVRAPVAMAPVGFGRLVHPEGEVAAARGADVAGCLFVLSTRSMSGFDELAPVLRSWWFQVYVLRDRGLTADLVRRAVDGGARALVLTADTPQVGTKARRNDVLSTVSTALTTELAARGGGDDSGDRQAADLTFGDIAWLRNVAGGLPVVVKGVLRADDARACVDAGAAAVWVSNHGGRQLDGAVATARALPEVVEAVGKSVPVYVDGGLRNGSDVLRALALGADAAFLGRPLSWALATGGAEGVRDELDRVRVELGEAMGLAGCRDLGEIGPDLLSPPDPR